MIEDVYFKALASAFDQNGFCQILFFFATLHKYET